MSPVVESPKPGSQPGEQPVAAKRGVSIAVWILVVIALGALALYILTSR